MNYGELKVKVAKWSHRTDLGDEMDLFAANVDNRLVARFGAGSEPLIADTDTNYFLTNQPDLYLYGMLRETSIYTHDASAVQTFEALYQAEIKQININYRDPDWIGTGPLVMGGCTEEEITDGT